MSDLAIGHDFEQYVGFPYAYERGPDVVRSREDAQFGLNCVALAHVVLDDIHGEALPPHMHAYEMFTDHEQLETVESVEHGQAADLIWFGIANPTISVGGFKPTYDTLGDLINWPDFPVRHVGILTGETVAGEPLVLHATRQTEASVIWPLSEFGRYGKYAEIYALQRYLGNAPRDVVGQSAQAEHQFA